MNKDKAKNMDTLFSKISQIVEGPKPGQLPPNTGHGAESITPGFVANLESDKYSEFCLTEKGHGAVSKAGVDPRVAFDAQTVRGVSDEILKTLVRDIVAKAMLANKNGKKSLALQMQVDSIVLMFKARDIDEGKGERMIFYQVFLELFDYYPETMKGCLLLIPKYGSWLDINRLLSMVEDQLKTMGDGAFRSNPKVISLVDLRKSMISLYVDQLIVDLESENPSLAGKWAPREARNGLTKVIARRIAIELYRDQSLTRDDGSVVVSLNDAYKELTKSPKNSDLLKVVEVAKASCYARYRKAVARLNTSVEVLMCDTEGRWSEVKPGAVPARCLKKNRKAFMNQSRKKGISFML